ncbi:MAG: NYN domain-containing protein [Bifidobacteriaceae bacterium]|nr:NYN domain-containing protein [Bifidobacteriaceae bacterium]
MFVDAGYLLASAATRVSGSSLRGGIKVHYEQLIAAMTAQAEEIAGLPLLRINWYDAAKNALPDKDQERIGALSRVKVRLGRVGFGGEQKGVDLRIGLDMVAQARNGAVDVILLVSGDDDLTEAVEEAQVHGVQVKVLAVPDKTGGPHGVSEHLLRASDGIELLAPESLDRTVLRVVGRPAAAPPVPLPGPLPGPRPAPAPRKPGPVPGPPPAYLPAPKFAESTLAYQSETGSPPSFAPEYADALADGRLVEAINEVVRGVIDSFLASATEEERGEVLRAKPSIRSDLDRALLLDLAHRTEDHDLSDQIRYQLREHFWEALADSKAG